MHYLEANKTAGEKARRQLHKNAANNIEQVRQATPHKAPTIRPPPITKTIQFRRTRHAGHCWRSRDELISDVLLWTPTYGRAKSGRPARTYIKQFCEDTGCSPEDLRWTIGRSSERGSGISMLAARHDDDDDDYDWYVRKTKPTSLEINFISISSLLESNLGIRLSLFVSLKDAMKFYTVRF